jgi:hypothetical protein
VPRQLPPGRASASAAAAPNRAGHTPERGRVLRAGHASGMLFTSPGLESAHASQRAAVAPPPGSRVGSGRGGGARAPARTGGSSAARCRLQQHIQKRGQGAGIKQCVKPRNTRTTTAPQSAALTTKHMPGGCWSQRTTTHDNTPQDTVPHHHTQERKRNKRITSHHIRPHQATPGHGHATICCCKGAAACARPTRTTTAPHPAGGGAWGGAPQPPTMVR